MTRFRLNIRRRTSLRVALSFLVLGLFSAQALAMNDLRELYRGARATAMGNAFTGLADDEQALYFNPAGLGWLKSTGLHLVMLGLEAPQDILGTVNALSNLNVGGTDALNAIMGKNIFTHVQLSPTFIGPNFGIGLILDQQLALYSKNLAYPQITLGYQTTNGVQAGYAFSLLSSSRRGKSGDLRLGVGGKLLWRRGGYRVLTLSELYSQMGSPNLDQLKSRVTGEFGRGYGVDAGLHYSKKLDSGLTFSAGTAWTEIGGVSFESGSDPQNGNLSAGAALKYETSGATLGLSYDYRHILQSVDWQLKQHLGFELKLPLVSFYGGLNQMHPAYGVMLNAWLFKVTAVSYREELNAGFKQDSERRYLLQVDLVLGL